MDVLITGGMGFVGSHLSKYLSSQGYEITIYDNFSNSKFQESSDSKIHTIKGDILDYSLLSKSLDGIDVVIHLAAQISVEDSIKNPDITIKINVDGTQTVLDACLKKNVKKFIALSSAAIFGESNILPLDENSKTIPISPYGKSKLDMEKIIINFSKKYEIDSIILRAFNIYGLGQSSQYAGVITKFLNQIKENKSLEIFGDGSQTRDFIHIEDLVRCIELSIQNIDEKAGRIYNIGSGQSTSILKLANLCLSLSDKQQEIIFNSKIKGEIMFSETSIEKAKKELGFKPEISLSDGLSKFLKS